MTLSVRLFLLTSLTMAAFAANSVLNRMALSGGSIGPADFALIRVLSGVVMLAVLVWWRDRKLVDLSEVSWKSAGALVLYVLGFSFGYITLSAGTGALILFGGVQVTMFSGALLAGERPSNTRWAGAGLAFLGLVWLLLPSAYAPDPVGAALMAAAAFGWGIYSLYGRKVARPLQATAGNFLLAVPVVILVSLVFPDPKDPLFGGILLAVLSGAVTSGMGYALWYSILPRLEASLAAVAQLTVPVIAVLAGIIVLDEVPTFGFWVSAVLVLGGVGLSALRQKPGD